MTTSPTAFCKRQAKSWPHSLSAFCTSPNQCFFIYLFLPFFLCACVRLYHCRTRLRLESLEDAIVLEKCDSDDGVWRKHGYPAYVTPEVLLSRGARYSGRAADLWSLGIILYTLLVGRYPFQDSGPFGLFTKIIRGHYTVPDFVSSRARCLIRNLLRRDPSQRLEASDILRHHWFSATLRPSKTDQLKNKPNEVVNAATGQLAARSEVNVFADQVVPEWKLNDQSNDVHHPHYRMPHC